MDVPLYDEVRPDVNGNSDLCHEVDTFEELLEKEDPSGMNSMVEFLRKYGFDFRIIDFPDDKIMVIDLDDGKYVVPDLSYPTFFEDAEIWVSNIYEHELYTYIPPNDFDPEFWDNPINPLFHGTQKENLDLIRQSGLKPMNQTRAISNRGTGSAIFTSENEEDVVGYGDLIVVIDTKMMKQDGYIIPVSKETPLEEENMRRQLAFKIGLKNYIGVDYGSEGIYDSTIIFYGAIPPKYLSFRDS